jgi:hypothetical protein
MGLGTSAVKLYLELWQRGLLKDTKSVLEMGSQELHLKQSTFEELVQAAGISHFDPKDFPNLGNWPAHPRCSSRHFYKLLGIEKYQSIDLNAEHGAIPLNLNEPLEDRSLWGKYDMVTDHGTNEHAFNVAEAYRTMHRLCRKGGLITIVQAVYGGNGYFNFDLSFFEGIAAANGYKILYSSYVVTVGQTQFHIPVARELLNALDWTKMSSIGICYVFQRQNDADFKFAYQGQYLAEVEKNAGYRLQFSSLPPSRAYIPMAGSGTAVAENLEQVPMKRLLGAALKKFKGKFQSTGSLQN